MFDFKLRDLTGHVNRLSKYTTDNLNKIIKFCNELELRIETLENQLNDKQK